jgi:hypothetical protein
MAGFMLVHEDLCSLTEIYARSRRFMRVRGDLCALGENLCAFTGIYARSWRFMRVRGDLCAFAEICVRSRRFMRVHGDLCAFAEIHARSFLHFYRALDLQLNASLKNLWKELRDNLSLTMIIIII